MYMDNKEFAKKLEYRTRQFGISVIKLSIALPNSIEAKVNNERSKRIISSFHFNLKQTLNL